MITESFIGISFILIFECIRKLTFYAQNTNKKTSSQDYQTLEIQQNSWIKDVQWEKRVFSKVEKSEARSRFLGARGEHHIRKTPFKNKGYEETKKKELEKTVESLQLFESDQMDVERATSSPKYKKSEGYYKINRIIDRRVTLEGKNEYRVRWKGYGPKDDTWEPEENFNKESLAEFTEQDKNSGESCERVNGGEKTYDIEKESSQNKIIEMKDENKNDENNLTLVELLQLKKKNNEDKTKNKRLKPKLKLRRCSLELDSLKQSGSPKTFFKSQNSLLNEQNPEIFRTKEVEASETMNINSDISFEHRKQKKMRNKNEKNLYEVKDIISRKTVMIKGKKKFRYRIRWVGFGPKDDTWEYVENLNDIDVEKFEKSLMPSVPKAQENLEIKKKCRLKFKPSKFCKIIDERIEKGKKLFKIHWKGFSSEDDTWEPIKNFNFGHQLLFSYEKRSRKIRKDIGTLKTMPSFREPFKRETFDEEENEKEAHLGLAVNEYFIDNIKEFENFESLSFPEENAKELFFTSLTKMGGESQCLIELKEIDEKDMEDENSIWKCIED